ncbi:uncharacterized protein BDZ83DRAFT_648684 [Colletotrichum acutatum]|uniref:Uncharacterized protein n=1 Tax=Glomerella acutata TaxID=27357 RepID=A0AAD8XIW1_GLOAC|nr:uncharacterized protein BDZ83DRAFT_648684 [Colletotrichum acutatum]KAK1728416.1 hypothetical protein BDZ83DRAFT_648684 [Colletotrichum acutatum]
MDDRKNADLLGTAGLSFDAQSLLISLQRAPLQETRTHRKMVIAESAPAEKRKVGLPALSFPNTCSKQGDGYGFGGGVLTMCSKALDDHLEEEEEGCVGGGPVTSDVFHGTKAGMLDAGAAGKAEEHVHEYLEYLTVELTLCRRCAPGGTLCIEICRFEGLLSYIPRHLPTNASYGMRWRLRCSPRFCTSQYPGPTGGKLTMKLSIIPPPIDRSNQVPFQSTSTSILIDAATLSEASEAQLSVTIPAQHSTNCNQTSLKT